LVYVLLVIFGDGALFLSALKLFTVMFVVEVVTV